MSSFEKLDNGILTDLVRKLVSDISTNMDTSMCEFLNESLKETKKAMDINDKLQEELQNVITENKRLTKEINNLNLQLDKVKKNTVLSKDMINREGRPPALTSQEIEFVKKLHKDGLSYRRIADKMDVSHTTIAKVVKEEKEQNLTEKAKDQDKDMSKSFQ